MKEEAVHWTGHRMSRCVVAAVLSLSLAACQTTHAIEPHGSTDAVANILAGEQVRVTLVDGGRAGFRVTEVTATHLIGVDSANQPVSIPIEAVARVEYYETDASKPLKVLGYVALGIGYVLLQVLVALGAVLGS